MFQILTEPPVSYVATLAMGFFIGVGMELLDAGLLTFSKENNESKAI